MKEGALTDTSARGMLCAKPMGPSFGGTLGVVLLFGSNVTAALSFGCRQKGDWPGVSRQRVECLLIWKPGFGPWDRNSGLRHYSIHEPILWF